MLPYQSINTGGTYCLSAKRLSELILFLCKVLFSCSVFWIGMWNGIHSVCACIYVGYSPVTTYFVSTTYFVLPDLFCINFLLISYYQIVL